MATNEFGIGDIVALKSHPFFQEVSSIVISGEAQLIPPLMVIAECFIDTKDLFDENTGDEITKKGNAQCKCLWFSNKTYQFEETWLSSKMLKLIKKSAANIEKTSLFTPEGDFFNVSFKTLELELGKKKSSLSKEENIGALYNNSKTIVNPLLSFVSPIMEILQVAQSKDAEQKDAKFDSKTGKQKRFTSKWLVKCKWFNPVADKFSEKFLPIDTLNIITKPDFTLLNKLTEIIKDGKCLILKTKEDKATTLIKPASIVYRIGRYYVKGYNFKLNQIGEFNIDKFELDEIDKYYSAKAPEFSYLRDGESARSVMDELQECISQASSKKALLRLKYLNRNNNLTYKTIRNYSIFTSTEEGKIVYYLNGICVARDEERTYRLDRIQNLEILRLKFE